MNGVIIEGSTLLSKNTTLEIMNLTSLTEYKLWINATDQENETFSSNWVYFTSVGMLLITIIIYIF